jgi:hypothetical protein
MTWQQGFAVAPQHVPYVLTDKYAVVGDLLQLSLHVGVVITPHDTNLGIL